MTKTQCNKMMLLADRARVKMNWIIYLANNPNVKDFTYKVAN